MNASKRLRVWADVNLQSLQSNLEQVRRRNSQAAVTAIVKSNAYGHGMAEVATALCSSSTAVECFGVATLDEAIALNAVGCGKRIMLLQGFSTAEELGYLIEAGLEFVIHADYQLAILKRVLPQQRVLRPLTVWLKLDTGMHRLGMTPAEYREAFAALDAMPQVGRVILMSHLACGDAPEDPDLSRRTVEQLGRFKHVCDRLGEQTDMAVARSMAASAGILAWPDTHFDYLRPGIMLYGGSPFAQTRAAELGLKPVMTLRARLVAVKQVASGGAIGYGATYTCAEPTRIGVVSIGYGDGYPRSAKNGTPVLVATPDGMRRTRLLGRVSMDMITIDLNDFPNAGPGDEVVLWGDDLDADEVARWAGTISYELFCRVTRRVSLRYT